MPFKTKFRIDCDGQEGCQNWGETWWDDLLGNYNPEQMDEIDRELRVFFTRMKEENWRTQWSDEKQRFLWICPSCYRQLNQITIF